MTSQIWILQVSIVHFLTLYIVFTLYYTTLSALSYLLLYLHYITLFCRHCHRPDHSFRIDQCLLYHIKIWSKAEILKIQWNQVDVHVFFDTHWYNCISSCLKGIKTFTEDNDQPNLTLAKVMAIVLAMVNLVINDSLVVVILVDSDGANGAACGGLGNSDIVDTYWHPSIHLPHLRVL